MTTTAIAIETTEMTNTTDTMDTMDTTRDGEQTTTNGDARENQRPAMEPHPRPETGTAYLPGATPGAIAINWK